MKICALIPAYNEVTAIGDVVQGTLPHVDRVIVIDDGSDDGTREEAQRAGAHCLRLETNKGKGTALRVGIRTVLKEDFSHLLFLDGDGQHNPGDIPSIIKVTISSDADMVIGTRTFDREKMPRNRYFSNSIGSKVASWLVGQKIQDSQCGFRLIKTEALRSLRLKSRKYEFEMEVLIKLSKKGCNIAHAPVTMVYDDGKARSKMKPVRDTVRICFCSLFFRYLDL